MNEELKIQLKVMIEKSDRTIKAAKDLLEHQDYESASSRSYYAVFYVLEALLLTKELSFSKHSGVISAFSKYFIKEGIFPKDFAEKINSLRQDRETGDYDYIVTTDNDTAASNIKTAEKLTSEIVGYLKELMVEGK
jgi:uncharacterized protein (UPF0332 family)